MQEIQPQKRQKALTSGDIREFSIKHHIDLIKRFKHKCLKLHISDVLCL